MKFPINLYYKTIRLGVTLSLILISLNLSAQEKKYKFGISAHTESFLPYNQSTENPIKRKIRPNFSKTFGLYAEREINKKSSINVIASYGLYKVYTSDYFFFEHTEMWTKFSEHYFGLDIQYNMLLSSNLYISTGINSMYSRGKDTYMGMGSIGDNIYYEEINTANDFTVGASLALKYNMKLYKQLHLEPFVLVGSYISDKDTFMISFNEDNTTYKQSYIPFYFRLGFNVKI